jgi:hypothetical protein
LGSLPSSRREPSFRSNTIGEEDKTLGKITAAGLGDQDVYYLVKWAFRQLYSKYVKPSGASKPTEQDRERMIAALVILVCAGAKDNKNKKHKAASIDDFLTAREMKAVNIGNFIGHLVKGPGGCRLPGGASHKNVKDNCTIFIELARCADAAIIRTIRKGVAAKLSNKVRRNASENEDDSESESADNSERHPPVGTSITSSAEAKAAAMLKQTLPSALVVEEVLADCISAFHSLTSIRMSPTSSYRQVSRLKEERLRLDSELQEHQVAQLQNYYHFLDELPTATAAYLEHSIESLRWKWFHMWQGVYDGLEREVLPGRQMSLLRDRSPHLEWRGKFGKVHQESFLPEHPLPDFKSFCAFVVEEGRALFHLLEDIIIKFAPSAAGTYQEEDGDKAFWDEVEARLENILKNVDGWTEIDRFEFIMERVASAVLVTPVSLL